MYGGDSISLQNMVSNEKCVGEVAQLIIVPKISLQYRLTRTGNVTK